ncbi:hypothetical protein ATG_15420 [Desulfurococcaceae archaeon AG1]|nr:hypothetical protein ATG_15420 [Desulfurococcaceae archaeon AG1]
MKIYYRIERAIGVGAGAGAAAVGKIYYRIERSQGELYRSQKRSLFKKIYYRIERPTPTHLYRSRTKYEDLL